MTVLTSGNPAKTLISFAGPIAIGRLLQTFYTMADTKIIGLFLGASALASVSSVAPVCHLLYVFIDGMALGFGIVIATANGKRNEKMVREAFTLSFYLILITTAVLSFFLFFFMDQLLYFLRIPQNELAAAKSYLAIICLGLLVTAFQNLLTNALRSIGNSLAALYILGISSLGNIAFDLFFICILKSGPEGAAFATVLSQVISAVICMIYIHHKVAVIGLKMLNRENCRALLPDLIKSGISMGLQSSIVNIGTVMLQMSINALDTAIIIAHSSARRVFELVYIPYASLGFAMVTFTATNHGAGQPDRIKKGYVAALKLLLCWTAAISLVNLCFAGRFIEFFASSDQAEILFWGSRYLWIEMPSMAICGLVLLTRNLLQGLGNRVIPLLSSVLELFVKGGCAFISLYLIGYWGVIMSEPVSWILMSILLIWGLQKRKSTNTDFPASWSIGGSNP